MPKACVLLWKSVSPASEGACNVAGRSSVVRGDLEVLDLPRRGAELAVVTSDYIAKAAANAMWAQDRASQALGMTITDIAPGHATLAMTVTEAMVNGHGLCHGGYIFALADSAFAFACNSHNQRAVAQTCTITFIAPAKLGDRLTAKCREVSRVGRSGIYDVTVAREDAEVVAEFRGLSRTVKGTLVLETGV